MGDPSPKLGKGVGLGVIDDMIRKCSISFLLIPSSDQRAISKCYAQLSIVTDRWMDKILWHIATLLSMLSHWSQKSVEK